MTLNRRSNPADPGHSLFGQVPQWMDARRRKVPGPHEGTPGAALRKCLLAGVSHGVDMMSIMDKFSAFELVTELVGPRVRRAIVVLFVIVAAFSPITTNRVVAWWVEHKSTQIVRQVLPILMPTAAATARP